MWYLRKMILKQNVGLRGQFKFKSKYYRVTQKLYLEDELLLHHFSKV